MNTIFLKIGVLLELISIEDILKWSEKNIIDNNISDVFLDLSSITLNDTKQDIINILEKYEKKPTDKEWVLFENILFSFLLGDIKNWKLIQKKMVCYYDIKYTETNYDDIFSYRLKDDFYLREDGFSGCMKMPKELEDYLKEKTTISHQGKSFLQMLDSFLIKKK